MGNHFEQAFIKSLNIHKKKHLLQRIKITKTEISSEKIYSSFNLSFFLNCLQVKNINIFKKTLKN